MANCEIDIAAGEVIHNVIDLYVPGLAELQLTRRYVSTCREQGLFGWGWAYDFVPFATYDDSGFTKHNPIDGDVFFPAAVCNGDIGPFVEFTDEVKHKDLIGNSRSTTSLFARYPNGNTELYVRTRNSKKRWALLHSKDTDGNSLAYRYQGNRLQRIERSDGLQVEFKYDHVDLLARLIAFARGFKQQPLLQVDYKYNQHGDLVEFHDQRGTWRYMYYDHHLIRSEDFNGHGRNYVYDASHRCIKAWHDGNHRIRTFRYDDKRQNVLVTDSNGFQTMLRLGPAGNIVEHVDSKGQVTQQMMDGDGGVLATVSANGDISKTFSFDEQTNVIAEYSAAGGIWERELDDSGRLIRITSPMGRSETYSYDLRGRQETMHKWNGGTFQIRYDKRGEVCAYVDPLGYELRREVSDAGKRVRFVDDFGVVMQQKFDGLYNLLEVVDCGGCATKYSYRAVDFPDKTQDTTGTDFWAYDANLNMIAHTDRLGHVWRTEYDVVGNTIAEINPLGGRIKYLYDKEDTLLQIVNEKKERLTIDYDELYSEVGIVYFDGKSVRYGVDATGRRTSITDAAGRTTTLSYQGSEIESQTFHDGTVQEFSLNPDGDFVSITSIPAPDSPEAPQIAEFSYDDNSNLTAEVHDDRTIEYEWNLCNHLVAIRDNLGHETIYKRGPRYRIDIITDLGREFRFKYTAAGEISEIHYPNGLRQLFDYDRARRVTHRRMLSPDNELLTWRRYKCDEADQLIEMIDWHWGEYQYDYDAAGRLVTVRNNGAISESYSYDATGNLLVSAGAANIEVGRGNRLLSVDDQSLTYDANGNLIGRIDDNHEWSYEWDRDEQLEAVKCDGETVAAFKYDLLNRRISKTTNRGTTEFLYETYSLRAELFHDGSWNHYLTLPLTSIPISQCANGQWFYYGINQIGTPIEVFDESGQLLLSVHPHAFGGFRRDHRPTTSDITLPFGFMGQYYDEECDLFYNHFRYYDARLGRYISQDPMGITGGKNLYLYPANPNNWVDPLGLMPTFTCPKSWGACQQWYARQKVKATNDAAASRRKKTCTDCRADAQRSDYTGKKCGGGTANSTQQIDHLYELQAGGPDRCCSNLRAVDKKFNNKLGSILNNETLAGLSPGDIIGKITMKGCTGKGTCSEEGKRRVAKPPPNADACEDDSPLDC